APGVGDAGEGEHRQDDEGWDGDQQEAALLDDDGTPFGPGERTAESDPDAELLTEDVAQEDGQNGSEHDGDDVPEVQRGPAVVDDEDRHRGDGRVDHPIPPAPKPSNPWFGR